MIKTIKNKINLLASNFRTIVYGKSRSGKWHTIEKHFLEKNNKCEICSSTNHLQVHHIKPFHLYPELELDENNLITLCMDKMECHLRIAHGSSYKFYNPKLLDHVKILQQDLSQFKKIAAEAKEIRVNE